MENGRLGAHILGMAKGPLALSALIFLTGCGFDSVKNREACEKLHPGDQAAADECFKRAKLDYDRAIWRVVGNPRP
jgi:hypothetical protein